MGLQVVTKGDDGTLIGNTFKLPADTSIGGSAVVALATITSASANALCVGRQGTTDPALNVACNVSSCVTGWNITARAAAAGVDLAAISSGANESARIDAKGTGTLTLGSVSTGLIQIGGAASGNNATGLTLDSAAAASGFAVAVISTGTDESLTVDAKGAGTISLNVTGTGAVILGRQARFKVVTVPVAAAGSTVSDAGQLAAANIVHITSDGATKGVKFATGVMGDEITVVNDSATACELYAASGGTINGLSADASVVIPASKGVWAQCTAANTWIAFDLPAKATAS